MVWKIEGKSKYRNADRYGENELKGKLKWNTKKDEYQSYSSDEERKRSEEINEEIEEEITMESENKRAISSLRKTVARLEKIVIELCSNWDKPSNMSEKSRKSLRTLNKKCDRK